MSINFYFYFFFILILFCSIMIIISKNPIQSVFFLILIYLMTAVIFVLLGAEFLAIAVLIIYVGAVAILFLFVVMMLNLRMVELYSSFNHYIPIASLIGLVYFVITFAINSGTLGNLQFNYFSQEDFFMIPQNLLYTSNVAYIGYVLYNFFSFFVIICALILLVAMLGSIILTIDFEYRTLSKSNVFNKRVLRRDLKY